VSYGPWETRVELAERTTNLTHLYIRSRPDASIFRVYGHKTLEGVYGNPAATGGGTSGVGGAGPTPFVDINQNGWWRSGSLIQRRLGFMGGSTRNQAHIMYDPIDLQTTAPAVFGGDEEWLFVRTQEFRPSLAAWNVVKGVTNNGDPIMGPIVCIPPRAWLYSGRDPVFQFSGTAPANAQCAAGSNPSLDLDLQNPNPLHLILPRRAARVEITAGGQALLYSTGLYEPMVALGANATVNIVGDVSQLVLASSDNGGGGAAQAPFDLRATITLGGP
jgi:hypothetical protein